MTAEITTTQWFNSDRSLGLGAAEMRQRYGWLVGPSKTDDYAVDLAALRIVRATRRDIDLSDEMLGIGSRILYRTERHIERRIDRYLTGRGE